MATEQALYGLVSAGRMLGGENSLYNMSDTVRRGAFAPIAPVGLPGRHGDVRRMEVIFPGRTFPDVQNHVSRLAIEALASREIINGRSASVFAPEETMTRGEFAAIITRGLGLPVRGTSVFSDVPSGSWFSAPVGTAFHYEIVQGTTATTFNPHGTITRQEAAVMVARGARLVGMNTALSEAEIERILAQFGDSQSVASWARAELAFLLREGILDDSASNLQPQRAILRGEIAEMLHRLLGQANLL